MHFIDTLWFLMFWRSARHATLKLSVMGNRVKTAKSIKSNKIKIVARNVRTDKARPKPQERPEVEALPLPPKRKPGFQPGKSGNPSGQFKPGQVSNPNGRSGKPIADAMRYFLAQPYRGRSVAYKSRGYTNGQVLSFNQVLAAMDGDMRAAEEVANRTEGKVPNPTTLSGPNGGPIDISAMTPEEKAIRIAELSARMLSAGE